MGELRLPRLIGSGMVLQQKKHVHIWGWDEPGRQIEVSFLGKTQMTISGGQGNWELWLPPAAPGGPYTMAIRDNAGECIVLEDVWTGEVWMCSGQSNMELPMNRVKDQYPDEIRTCENPLIRTFKITEHTDYHGPIMELQSGQWKAANPQTILDFSATAYFFAKETVRLTGVPVGLINASLGGSRIESWMSRDMLDGYEELLALADRYADDAFVEGQKQKNMENTQCWHEYLNRMDAGLIQHWEMEETEIKGWNPIQLPAFFKDTELAGFIGSVWLRRTFEVSDAFAAKKANLWLGTLVDSDIVYVNGVEVGRTEYQYPPRKYPVPEGLLRPGTNTVVIRLRCENGCGRITPGKRRSIWNEEGEVELDGTWLYRIGTVCEQIRPTDFVNWKPTGLYNAMTAPCHAYTISGVIWYQGEANAHMPDCLTYADRMRRLVEGYRNKWQDPELPFLYVQLPNFRIDVYHGSEEERDSCWAEMREQQRMAQEIPGVGMIVAMDLGEDNDLHPLNKQGIGTRLARLAERMAAGAKEEAQGPEPESAVYEAWRPGEEARIRLSCRNCAGRLYADSENKGTRILDFELVDSSGTAYPAQASICGTEVYLCVCGMEKLPVQIRYCWRNAPEGALIYNGQDLPMSPFIMKIEGAEYETVVE